MKYTFLLSFLLQGLVAFTQEDVVILTEFKTTVTEEQVGVSFTLAPGSFCYGAQLERALDTLNEAGFQQIGEITGVCGHQDFESSYTLWDENPIPNRQVYYRVITGFIPTGFLPVQFNDFGASGHRIGPNPWTEQTTISINNPESKSVEILLYNAAGQFVSQQRLGNSNEVRFYRNSLIRGIYMYVVLLDGSNVGSGKMVIQ